MVETFSQCQKKFKKCLKNRSNSTLSNTLDLLYTSTKTGKTSSLRVSKLWLFILGLFFILMSFTLIFFSTKYYKSAQKIKELEIGSLSKTGLKSEMDTLILKIKTLHERIDSIESVSNKIKKITQRIDERKTGVNHKNIQIIPDEMRALGIGPLTKEEFELSKRLTGIKSDKLELKNIFGFLQESDLASNNFLSDLRHFLSDAQRNATKLYYIPDVAPARGYLTSGFGWRLNPFSGTKRIHLGLDIAAPIGSPIYATAQGVVTKVAHTNDYGKVVEVMHDKKMLTRYAHTSIIYVKTGQKINKGDIIAAVGNTGHSTGPHVHYEIEVNGRRIDPENYIVIW